MNSYWTSWYLGANETISIFKIPVETDQSHTVNVICIYPLILERKKKKHAALHVKLGGFFNI